MQIGVLRQSLATADNQEKTVIAPITITVPCQEVQYSTVQDRKSIAHAHLSSDYQYESNRNSHK